MNNHVHVVGYVQEISLHKLNANFESRRLGYRNEQLRVEEVI